MEDTQKVSPAVENSPQNWWIATDVLARGGEKILGPFATKELALNVRRYVELAEAPRTFWVDRDEAAEIPQASP
jgi:hypothetical protein